MRARIIPVLLLSDGGLVKTKKFKKPAYIGDPINAIRILNEKEVDELIVLDISATVSGNEPDYKTLEKISAECFMPLTYGGGINSLSHADRIFNLGIEKVSLNSAAINQPSCLVEISSKYGKQSVVVSFDVKRDFFGRFCLYDYNKKKIVNQKILDGVFLDKILSLGVGEILLNSVDNDGCRNGYNIQLISELSRKIEVPLIALGGSSGLQDFKKALQAGASAAAAGSCFVFNGPHDAVLISYIKNTDFMALEK